MQPNKEYNDFALFDNSLTLMRQALQQTPGSLMKRLMRKCSHTKMYVFELLEEELQSAFAGEEELLYSSAWRSFNTYLLKRLERREDGLSKAQMKAVSKAVSANSTPKKQGSQPAAGLSPFGKPAGESAASGAPT